MSLSAYERTQFERLTADLALGDPTDLKKMSKREKATAMSYVPLPRLSLILRVLAVIAVMVAIGGSISDNVVLMSAGGTACFGLFMLSSGYEYVAHRKTGTGK